MVSNMCLAGAKTGAERFLREISGTCLGALCECMIIMLKHSVAPAITVRKENVDALIRVVPPVSGPLQGWRRLTALLC